MKVLIVGGAGYVGSIVRPGLEAEHECYYYDRKPVPGRESRTTIADVTDANRIKEAVRGMDAIIYMAMGTKSIETSTTGHRVDIMDLGIAYAVNTGGWHGFVSAGLDAGVRRFVYTSSLSVFASEMPPYKLTEERPTDAWHPYGLSKRCGEYICAAAAARAPEATFISLRIMAPRNAEHFAQRERMWADRENPMLGPLDTTRLYLTALACTKPGAHMIHASGDVKEKWYSHRAAREVMGWEARGE